MAWAVSSPDLPCEGEHRALHEVELLLEVVKANPSIDLVPVEHPSLVRHFWVGAVLDALKAGVDILII